jgi:hypothetical protein
MSSDSAGVCRLGPILVTPDGKSCLYGYLSSYSVRPLPLPRGRIKVEERATASVAVAAHSQIERSFQRSPLTTIGFPLAEKSSTLLVSEAGKMRLVMAIVPFCA